MNTDRMMKLLYLIDAELYGKNRRLKIVNYTRQIKMEINKYNRRKHKES